MRIVRSLLAFAFVLIGAAAVGLVLALYLAATGRSLPVLRAVVARVGQTIAGQQTTALALQLRLRPDAAALSGTAQLSVRADSPGRQRVYFLLNDGLRLDAVWEVGADGARAPLAFYRLLMLTIVDLPRALDAGEEIRLGFAYGGRPRIGGLTASGGVLQPDDVVITPADFWYPADLQGFFDADVEVTLPADLTLVHNGREANRSVEGTSARVRWASDRPIAGLSLVAGRYTAHAREHDGIAYRVLLPAGVDLDAERLLDSLSVSQQGLATHYGPSGFARTTLYVNRRLPRAFNDGTGLLAMPPRYFRDGDYGYEAIAHEVAHNWWGATVAEFWLQPGSGGQWIVEGFAEFSGWRAVRERLGESALLRTLAESGYDPDSTATLQAQSVLDNGLDRDARPIIYNKGGYVTYMLEQRLGSEAFDAAARQFIDQFRHRGATGADVETVFAASSQQDLAPFFAAWVRGADALDLALEPQEGGALVRNLRTAPAPDALALWRFAGDAAPEALSTAVGAATPLGDASRLVVDPLAAVADMLRGNNVLPRYANPRAVAASPRGDIMVVSGESAAWEAATVDVLDRAGALRHSWPIDRGLLSMPGWSADGTRVLAVESPRGGQPALLALNPADGSRQTIGRDAVASGSADATIVARGDRLLRLAGRTETVLAVHPEGKVGAPLAAPQGGAIAYAVSWGADMDLRLLPAGAEESRVLFTWPSGPVRWRWSPDGARLYVVLGGDWDWQLWELPLDGSEPRALVREAAGIADLAVADDGDRVALVAQAEVDDPRGRREIFLIDRRAAGVRRYDIAGWTASSATWHDDDSLLVVVADAAHPSVPPHRELRTLRLADGALEAFP